MTILVPIALFGWVPVVLVLFSKVPSRQATIIAFLGAWMFLPAEVQYKISTIPAYDRCSATVIAVLLGTAMFDAAKFRGLHLRLLDLPMILWCLCPFASSLSNGLGPYDGLSAVLRQTTIWGLPYLIGRMYLRRFEDMQQVALLTVLAGLVYVPLCLYEIRMSPNLNYDVYGFGGSGIEYSGLGKWGSRPSVFMGTALTVGLFMSAATLMGFWLWTTRAITRIRGYSAGWLVFILAATSILGKNMGALGLLGMGLAVLATFRWPRTRLAIYLLAIAAPTWIALRSTGTWSAGAMVDAVSAIHEDRANSLITRLKNEDQLAAKALQQPAFGWGGWGRNRIYDDQGEDISLTDGMWVIAMGTCGVTGLVAYYATLLLPPLALLRRIPRRGLAHPMLAGSVAIAVFLVLFAIDGVFNSITTSPLYFVMTGGIVNVVAATAGLRRRPKMAATRAGAPAVNTMRPPAFGVARTMCSSFPHQH